MPPRKRQSVLVPEPDPLDVIRDAIGEMTMEEIKCRDHHVWPPDWNAVWVIVGEYGGCWEERMTCQRCGYTKSHYTHPTTGHIIGYGRADYSQSSYMKHPGVGSTLLSLDGRGQLRLARIESSGVTPPTPPSTNGSAHKKRTRRK